MTYNLTPQDMDALSDYRDYVPPMTEEQIRQSEREKSDKIFDHTIALCEALIERFDSQSQLGFNALIIKRDIESLRRKT